MKRHLFLGLLLLAAASIVGGCGKGPATAKPGPSSPTTVAAPAATPAPIPAQAQPGAGASPASATTAPEAPATPAAVAPGDATALPGPPTVGTPPPTVDVQANLPPFKSDAVTSYTVQIEMRDEPMDAGTEAKPMPPQLTIMQYRGKPQPELYAWSFGTAAQGSTPATQDSKSVMVGPNFYSFDPSQNRWVKMPPSVGSGDLPLKEDILDPGRIAQASPPGTFNTVNIVSARENLNGVETTHYRANASQVQELIQGAADGTRTPTSGSADFWVDNRNGYLKQYIMIANLKDPQGQQSRQTVKFTVTNENKPVNIATPAPNQVITWEDLQLTPQPTPEATP